MVEIVVDVDYQVQIDANRDHIITNADANGALTVDYSALMANDGVTVNSVVNTVTADLGTDLTTGSDSLTLSNLADGDSFTYELSDNSDLLLSPVTDSTGVDVELVNSDVLLGTSRDDILINTRSVVGEVTNNA